MHPEHRSRLHPAGVARQATFSRHWRRTGALIVTVVTAVVVALFTLALLAPPVSAT